MAAFLGFGGVMGAASAAHAVPCTNDDDCATATCGGMVCQWGAGGHVCVDAGTDPKGTDGWCTTDDDCKCKGLGATCEGVHCSFTLPGDAPQAEAQADAAVPVEASPDTAPATETNEAETTVAAETATAETTVAAETTADAAPKADDSGCAGGGTDGLAALAGLAGVAFVARRRAA